MTDNNNDILTFSTIQGAVEEYKKSKEENLKSVKTKILSNYLVCLEKSRLTKTITVGLAENKKDIIIVEDFYPNGTGVNKDLEDYSLVDRDNLIYEDMSNYIVGEKGSFIDKVKTILQNKFEVHTENIKTDSEGQKNIFRINVFLLDDNQQKNDTNTQSGCVIL